MDNLNESKNLPSISLDVSALDNRAEQLKKAQQKLSSNSNPNATHRRHRNSLSSYPVFQSDSSYDQEVYNTTSSSIQRELSNQDFKEPVKAVEKWANQLNSSQLLTLGCVLFKRLDASQINIVQNLLKQCHKEPAFFFGVLTKAVNDEPKNGDEEDDSISKLMSALTIAEATKKKTSGNPYRKSLPVTFDLNMSKPRYEPFSMDIPEDTAQSSPYYGSRTPTFNEETFNGLPKHDWLTPQTRNLTTISPEMPNRIRPKSMFEPGLLNVSWNDEEDITMNRMSKMQNEVNLWNAPISPSFLKNPNNNPNNYNLNHFNESRRTHNALSINIQPDNYIPTTTYSAGIPPRNMYHQTMPNTPNPSMLNANSGSFSPSNWMGFKDKSKRKSQGENEAFAQNARNMFSNIPNTFRKHLMKPHNKVDFDLLQDIPAWLRSLRLHKYTEAFDGMVWQDIIKLTDEELSEKGISALGARRKMLKHFELVKQELQNKNKVK